MISKNSSAKDINALIITGPTGVGKSDLALQLGQEVPIEIINADVGQFYEPLTIGTAKPDWRSMQVVHHLFDILREPSDFTVAAYRCSLETLLKDIVSRNKIPVIVGGSLFYIKSLFFPPEKYSNNNHNFSGDSPASRNFTDDPWQHLFKIDPDRALAIGKNDLYRINRALEIWYRFKVKPSQMAPKFDPIMRCTTIYVTRERQNLYQRINLRTRQMMKEGWLDEVRRLRGTEWEQFLLKKKLIGYREILQFFNGKQTAQEYETLIEKIALNTRHYAKRQDTFWRSMCTAINANQAIDLIKFSCMQLDLTLLPHDLYIKQLTSLCNDMKN